MDESFDPTLPAPQDEPGGADVSTLAWVQGELRRSLEAAHKGLRRYLKEAEALAHSDVDVVDPAILRGARAQLHQGVGVLELVGQPAAAQVLRASEAAVQRLASKPSLVNIAAVETLERASFALLDFIGRVIAGKAVSPVALFPQYAGVQALAGADRVHPADLWTVDWLWHELPSDGSVAPVPADDAARGQMEALVLQQMRRPDHVPTLQALAELCAGLGAGARQDAGTGGSRLGTLWQLAAAFFEAQRQGLLTTDTHTKRVASRLLAQLRATVRGSDEVSDRLAQDLLFFCAHARPPAGGRMSPRLAAVRLAWQVDDAAAADYETPRLGRFDPSWLLQAKKRVATARESWSAVAGGELHRLTGLPEQLALVGDSLQRLFPAGDVLAASLQKAGARTVAGGAEPPPALAMEVATSILYLDACLEDGELDMPELADRVKRLAERIDAVANGAEPEPLEVWMEELYRRVSDRQTMGSVVQELRSSLSEIEKQIDQYFRDPSQRQLLIPVPGQLSAMRGVLSVLGLGQASQAVLRMRDDVDQLAQTEVDPQRAVQTGTFDRLADNLGALSFLIDMLSVQPALAKSLFHFDPATGGLQAVMGQSERPSVFAAFETTMTATDGDTVASTTPLGLAVADDVQPTIRDDRLYAASGFAPLEPVAPLPPTPVPAASASAPASSGLEEDEEMREIFIEEAREVIDNARASMQRLAEAPDDVAEFTAVRRAFHTLKGSSRMVGLRDFGEAGWACEQLYNARLAEMARMDDALQTFTGQALDYLADWTDAIAERRDGGHAPADVATAADALRLEGRRIDVPWPGATAAAAPAGPVPEPVVELPFAPAVEMPFEAAFEVPVETPAEVPFELALPTYEPAPEPPAEPASLPELASLPDGWGSIETVEVVEPVGEPLAEPVAEPFAAEAPADLPVDAPLDLSFDVPMEAPADAPLDLTLHGAPEVVETLDLSFDMPAAERVTDSAGNADALERTTPLPVLQTPEPLAARVPDLPSAADLDLSLDLDLPAPGETTQVLPTLDVTVDVGSPAPESVDTREHVTLDFSDAVPPADIAAPDVEAIELDLSAFEAGGEPAPEPAAGPAPDLVLDLAFDAPVEPAPMADAPSAADWAAAPPAVDPVVEPLAEAFAPAPFEPEPALASGFAPLEPQPAPMDAEPAFEAPAEPLSEAGAEEEQVKIIGPLRVSIPLFNIYLNEADELSRRLGTELAEWGHEYDRVPIPESTVALAHSLAGSSATVGYADLSALARSLEHALMRSQAVGRGRTGEPELFSEVGDEIRRLLHQFAAGFLREVQPALLARLSDHERWPIPTPVSEYGSLEDVIDEPPPLPASVPMAAADVLEVLEEDEALDAVDSIDDELFPIFEDEADELLPQLHQRLREWAGHPNDRAAASACMRTLHTFKGGARLAGAMRVGELAHRLETAIEQLLSREHLEAVDVERVTARADAMTAVFEALRAAPALEPVSEMSPLAMPDAAPVDLPPAFAGQPPELPLQPLPVSAPEAPAWTPPVAAPAAVGAPVPAPVFVDWSRFRSGAGLAAAPVAERAGGAGAGAVVRVRGGLLDRLVNHAGEVSITRARLDADVRQLQGSLNELTDSLDRLRRQLRDIELQAETQLASRLEAAKAASASFDPLEMDRFTRFQELTRFMAESVNDVATLQRSLQRTLQSTEDQLAAQARLTRELQDDLLRTRMVEFDSMSERLYRVVRQAAKDTGKQVRLDVVGGAIEIDRGVLERMVGPFEHLLRNCVAHGIEDAAARESVGKDRVGAITVTVTQEGNEVGVEVRDDGAGLDMARIRARAVERGLLAPDAWPADADLAQLIFAPGFSTADTVTELAGRGVGMDVVRSEVNAMGGRVITGSTPGRGTSFKLLLPLTTAVTQVVMLRCGELRIAVPSTLVEVVRRVKGDEIERAYSSGGFEVNGEMVPFHWLAALLQAGVRGPTGGRTQPVVVIRSAAQRVALHVDEVLGNQEVVVKNVGPQLAHLPGLAGVTLLPSGQVALIYNPVALATLYGPAARERLFEAPSAEPAQVQPAEAAASESRAPLVLVVDDSLTVRRVTQRLLVREGYRVVTAKDGLDALERLAEERPTIMLSDIEMPRMDGFDLARNVRADTRLADLPIVMITSRIAQKHRDYAAQLGVDHYLGKPYSEEELLSLVARYAGADIAT